MPHGGVLSASPFLYGEPIEPSSLIVQLAEARYIVASCVPGYRWRATGLAVVSAQRLVRGSSARTVISLNLPLSSQTQVGRFTVDLAVGLSSISVSGTCTLL